MDKNLAHPNVLFLSSVGGLRQQFSLAENIRIGLFARDFIRNYPESIFEGCIFCKFFERKLVNEFLSQ